MSLTGFAALLAAALLAAVLHQTPAPPQVSVIPPPVFVSAPPIVVVPAAAPAAPAPEPAAEPEPAPLPPRPRATTPMVNADCVMYNEESPAPECEWDTGFPAISADGKTVVTAFIPDDGQRGYPGLSIHVFDVRTAKLVRAVLVLDPEEYGAENPDGDGDAGGDQPRLRAKVMRRAAAAQRLLDAGHYRTLDALASRAWNSDDTETDRSRVHAEIEGDLVRAIDPAANRVLWQHRFAVEAPTGRGDPDGECSGFSLHEMHVWWDPTTRVVVSTQDYAAGGCMCGVYQYELVKRM